MPTSCQPGANHFIQQWFGDCIYNARDMTGFLLGMASIACWLVAQVPQLLTNYRNQSADALSAFFLAEWLLGDTCNLLGALLTGDQLPTVVFTAQYFICMDVVLLIQYIYYISLQRRRERTLARRSRHRHRHHHHHRHSRGGASMLEQQHPHAHHPQQSQQQQQQQQQQQHSRGATAGDAGPLVLAHADPGGTVSGCGNGREFVFRPQRVLACVGLVFLLSGVQQQGQQGQLGAAPGVHGLRRLLVVGSASAEVLSKMPTWSQDVGTVVAYCSSVLYLTSRVSQIYKNLRRRSAEGLALSMFLCAMAANTLYGLSIVVRAYSLASLRSSAPWLVGSLGTVALDTTIFVQGLVYGTHKKHTSDEEEQLLPEDETKH